MILAEETWTQTRVLIVFAPTEPLIISVTAIMLYMLDKGKHSVKLKDTCISLNKNTR